MKKFLLSTIILFSMVQAKASSTEVYSLGELKNESFSATIADSSGSKLSCVADKTFFFSSKQQGTHPIRDTYRVLYKFPTLGLYGTKSQNFISIGPVAQFEGVRSLDEFKTQAECQKAINALFSQSSEEILTRIPAEVSMSLQLKMTHFPEQSCCRRSVRESFRLTLGTSPAIAFADILGLTQNNLATNEAFVEIQADSSTCFNLPRIEQ